MAGKKRATETSHPASMVDWRQKRPIKAEIRLDFEGGAAVGIEIPHAHLEMDLETTSDTTYRIFDPTTIRNMHAEHTFQIKGYEGFTITEWSPADRPTYLLHMIWCKVCGEKKRFLSKEDRGAWSISHTTETEHNDWLVVDQYDRP